LANLKNHQKKVNVMTKFNDKFVPQAPKTYEVKYLENTQQSNLSKIADCLGFSRVECSGNSNSDFLQRLIATKAAEEAAKSSSALNLPITPNPIALESTRKAADSFAERVERSGGEAECRVERTGDTSAYYRKNEK